MRLNLSGRTAIGLDLGQRSVGAMQLAGRPGAWRVEAATSVDRATSADGSGELPSAHELERLAEVLKRQGFTGRKVVLAAPDTKVFSAALELPPRSSGAPIEDLARQELARAARRDVNAIEVACWEVPSPPRTIEGTNVLAVGLAHEDAERLLDAMENAGFIVEAMDCRCLAMSRASRGVLGDVAQVSSILDLSDAAASLTVVHSGIVAYDRPMREAGLAQLRKALRKELKVDAEGAEFLLERVGMAGGDESLSEHTLRAAKGLVDDHVGIVIQELRSVMAYAMHRYPGSVGPVLLTGEGALLVGLADKVRGELDLEARVVRPAELVEVPAELAAACDDPSLCAAVGLAMYSPVAARRAA